MLAIELPNSEHDALVALKQARDAYPEADFFEHDRVSVRMLGARHDVRLAIDRETLRRLGHHKVVTFLRHRDRLGHGRWTFDLTPRAADFV